MHRKSGFLYGNMNIFSYKVKAERRKIHHGIDIKICLLGQLPNRKTKFGIKHVKKAKTLMYREYEERKAVKIVSNIAKVALNRPMNKYHRSLLKRVKIDRWEDLQDYERVGQGKFSYPGEFFKGGVKSIYVDDNHQFSIPTNLEEILKIQFEDKWNVVGDRVNRDTANELLDTSIGYENIVSMPSFIQLMEEANRYREADRLVGKKKAKWAKAKRKHWRIINQVIEDLQ